MLFVTIIEIFYGLNRMPFIKRLVLIAIFFISTVSAAIFEEVRNGDARHFYKGSIRRLWSVLKDRNFNEGSCLHFLGSQTGPLIEMSILIFLNDINLKKSS